MATRYARASDVLWRRTATAVVIRTVDGRGTTLQGTAPALWDALERPATFDELVRQMHVRYTDPEGTMTDDIGRALRALLDYGVVTELDDG